MSVCTLPPPAHQSASKSLTLTLWHSGAVQPLQKAVSLWKKRPGVKTLLEFGVLGAKSKGSLHTATMRHGADHGPSPVAPCHALAPPQIPLSSGRSAADEL